MLAIDRRWKVAFANAGLIRLLLVGNFPEHVNSPILTRLLWVRGLRAFADGYVSLLLPIYLIALDMTPFQVGIITTATLIGSGVLTLLIGLQAYRFKYRTLLLMAGALMAGTGLGFASVTDFWPLLLIAFIGTLNPSSGDVSIFLPLEHAVLSRFVEDGGARQSLRAIAWWEHWSQPLAHWRPDCLIWCVAATHIDTQGCTASDVHAVRDIGLLAASIYATLPKEVATDDGMRKPGPLRKSKRNRLYASCTIQP